MRRWGIRIGLAVAGIALFALGWLFAMQVARGTAQAQIEQAVDAEATEIAREAPDLLSPGDDEVFGDASQVQLHWQYDHPLAQDEVYDVRVWRDGQPAYGITWTTDPQFDLSQWLLEQPPGDFNWSVAVLRRLADGKTTEEVTDAAPSRHFTVQKNTLDIVTVPDGFQAQQVARLPISYPTVITFGPDYALYALSVGGAIARLTDDDGDGTFEDAKVIYTDKDASLDHAVGMAFRGSTLYVSSAGRITTVTDSDGDGTLDTIAPIVTGLPNQQYTFHSNNGIAFGPDDKLYMAVGATTDHGPIHDPLEASILRANPDGSNLEVFARGFRNPYDLAFSPQGELFSADNSPDALGPEMPYLPPEELDLVKQGKNYGFPDVYGFPPPGSNVEAPVTDLLTSSASSGLTYYAADQFPEAYHGVYVASFGTGADFPASLHLSTGQMVVFVALTPDGKGGYTGNWQPFARFPIDARNYHPIDVTVGPDGALYIAEWTTATVFRVSYVGAAAAATETPAATSSANAAQVALGQDIFNNGRNGAPACASCHVLDPYRSGVGPNLLGLSARAAGRIPGTSAEDYVRQSITDPNAYVVSGFQSGLMYQDYAQKLSADEINALVAYVLSLPAS